MPPWPADGRIAAASSDVLAPNGTAYLAQGQQGSSKDRKTDQDDSCVAFTINKATKGPCSRPEFDLPAAAGRLDPAPDDRHGPK